MRVGVVGAGIFGCMAAVELALHGHDVALFEKNSEILNGATPNSQNRLHLGLHYPRDLDTAKQSIEGFDSFRTVFADALNLDFPNYYALAKNHSKVSVEEFKEFSKAAGIQIREISSNESLPNGIKIKNVESIWECDEGVIDMTVLRDILANQINTSRVELHLNAEVSTLEQNSDTWVLSTNSTRREFDFIVKCTYSSDTINILSEDFKPRKRMFHKTLIQVLDSEVNNFGITIIDGDFLTILPKGLGLRLLAYGPSVSTRKAVEGYYLPENWSEASEMEINAFRNQIQKRIDDWIDGWDYTLTHDYLEAIRTIEVGVESTDRRTSLIVESGPRMLDIWSGKIDHAVEISKKIPRIIDGY